MVVNHANVRRFFKSDCDEQIIYIFIHLPDAGAGAHFEGRGHTYLAIVVEFLFTVVKSAPLVLLGQRW